MIFSENRIAFIFPLDVCSRGLPAEFTGSLGVILSNIGYADGADGSIEGASKFSALTKSHIILTNNVVSTFSRSSMVQ